jgi:alpha-1,2-mannosyltransferase
VEGGRRLRRLVWQVPAVLGFLAAVWAFLAVAAERHGFFDLKVYYGAINFWAHGHGELYDFLLPRTVYGFTYPPFAALTMLPMAYVPWPVAIAISVTITVLASLAVLYRLVDPIARRRGWPRWLTLVVAAGLVAAFEPMRETVNFGQVNMLLVFLVAADLLLLVGPGRRAAGIGIGLATAIKLTPGIFIVYLLITRRWAAAATAAVTATVATLFAGAVIPDTSRVFWTDALWNTDRIGSQSFVSNQSLNGIVARLNPVEPSRPLWLAAVAVVLVVWMLRVRAAHRRGDEVGGFALTAVTGCLLSPITWIHHLVWLLPALIGVFDHALDRSLPVGRRRWLLGWAVATYALLSSRLVWAYAFDFEGWGVLMANAYVWASLALLVGMPLRRAGAGAAGHSARGGPGVPDDRQVDAGAARPGNGKAAGRAVGGEAAPLVEQPGGLVGVEHP